MCCCRYTDGDRCKQQIHEVVSTSERRLDLALRGSGDGLWDWDINTGDIYRSHVDQVLCGDARNLQVERPFADLEIHPDDLARVELELERHLEGASERFEVEYRLRDPSGGWRWILDRGDVVERDPRGRPRRMAGTFKDMTRQKQVERELRLWQAVFESVSEGVVILDVWGRIRAANPAFCKLTGWRLADLLGQRSDLLESKQHEASFYRKIRRQLVNEGRWQGEVHQSQRQRGSFLAWIDINAVADDAGQITHFVAVCTDITRRKETEEELRPPCQLRRPHWPAQPQPIPGTAGRGAGGSQAPGTPSSAPFRRPRPVQTDQRHAGA